MIAPARRQLLELLEEISATCPEYRFGQLVLNLTFLAREEGDRQAWHIEDAEFVASARQLLADWYASHDAPTDAPRPGPAVPQSHP